MKYRCPYCKSLLEDPVPSCCPSCGRTVIVPKRMSAEMRHLKRKNRERILRDFEQQKEMLSSVGSNLFRIPRKRLLFVVLFLFIFGACLISSADKSVQRRMTVNPVSRTMKSVDALAQALARYRHDTGCYPSPEDGLVSLVRDPGVAGWGGPYVNQIRNDIWSKPYVYMPPADSSTFPVLYSCGPDRLPETDDDIRPAAENFTPTAKWLSGKALKGKK